MEERVRAAESDYGVMLKIESKGWTVQVRKVSFGCSKYWSYESCSHMTSFQILCLIIAARGLTSNLLWNGYLLATSQ